MTSSRHRRTIAPLVVAGVAIASLSAPAAAGDGDVISRGSCSASSDWKVKASPENGRIEVEGEIDSSRVGQTWTWKLLQNGSVAARGQGVTAARSGSFEVRRVLPNLPGTDVVAIRARNASTGEACRGSLSY